MLKLQVHGSSSNLPSVESTPEADAALRAVMAKFDKALAALHAPDADQRLREIMRMGAKLDGQVMVDAAPEAPVYGVEQPGQE